MWNNTSDKVFMDRVAMRTRSQNHDLLTVLEKNKAGIKRINLLRNWLGYRSITINEL